MSIKSYASQDWVDKTLKNTQADWGQNDPTAADYIKNRTHYSEIIFKEIFNKTITIDENAEYIETTLLNLELNLVYVVNFNGIEYSTKCQAFDLDGSYGLGLGNLSFLDSSYEDTQEPYVIIEIPSENVWGFISVNGEGSYPLTISGWSKIIHPLDTEYLPAAITDWHESNKELASYIKNRPLYNYDKIINVNEEYLKGAYSVVDTYGWTWVKIADFFPYGEEIFRMQIGYSVADNLDYWWKEHSITNKNSHCWQIEDMDMKYLIAFDSEAIKDTSLNKINITEPGIYSVTSDQLLENKVSFVFNIPQIKKLNNDNLAITCQNIIDMPCYETSSTLLEAPVFSSTQTRPMIISPSRDYSIHFRIFSPKFLSIDEIIGATITFTDNSTKIITQNDVVNIEEGKIWYIPGVLFSLNEGFNIFALQKYGYNFDNSIVSSSGVYAYTTVASIQLTGAIKKLDNKFINAEWMASSNLIKGKTILERTTVEGLAADMTNSDMPIAGMFVGSVPVDATLFTIGKKYYITFGDQTYLVEAYDGEATGDVAGTIYVGLINQSPYFSIMCNTTGPSPMTWCDRSSTESIEICEAIFHNHLPEKYLPESVDSIIIRSSTEGSTKRFKITVDDSGIITATEMI